MRIEDSKKEDNSFNAYRIKRLTAPGIDGRGVPSAVGQPPHRVLHQSAAGLRMGVASDGVPDERVGPRWG